MVDFIPIASLIIIAVGFMFAALVVGSLVRPRRFDPEKLATYECGERPFHKAWFNYNPRFYIFALVFIVFDVAVVIIFPPLATFKSAVLQNAAMVPFLGITAFIAVVSAPLVYLWKRGDLDWIKKE